MGKRKIGGNIVTNEMIETTFNKDQNNFLYAISQNIIKDVTSRAGGDDDEVSMGEDDVYLYNGSIAVQFGLELREVVTNNSEAALKTIKQRIKDCGLRVSHAKDFLINLGHTTLFDLSNSNEQIKNYCGMSFPISNELRIKILRMLNALVIPVNLAVPVHDLKKTIDWTYNDVFKINKLITEDSKFDGKESIKAFEALYSEKDYDAILKAALRFMELSKLSIVFYDALLNIKELCFISEEKKDGDKDYEPYTIYNNELISPIMDKIFEEK
jgi:hypothetical protein